MMQFNYNEMGMTRQDWAECVTRMRHSVYLAESRALEMLKIGRSSFDPRVRVAAFRSRRRLGASFDWSNSPDWQIVAQIEAHHDIEGDLHTILAAFRHPAAPPKAREWYRDCPQVRAAFDLLVKELA